MDKWDYCIVGAGVLGCAIGKTLLEREPNASILIVEKNSNAGQGNTIRSNAAYRNIFDTNLSVEIAASSINYYKAMEQEGYDFGRREIGYLFLLTDEQYKSYQVSNINYQNKDMSFFQFLDKLAIKYHIFNSEELSSIFPQLVLSPQTETAKLIGVKPIKYGFLGLQCGNFAPDLVVNHYLEKYLETGGKVQYSNRVKSLKLGTPGEVYDPDYVPKVWQDKEIKAIEVIRENQEVEMIFADKFILATGAWINELLDPIGARSFIKAKKRQLFTIENLGDFVVNANFPTNLDILPFTILPTGGVHIKPVGNSNHVVVGTSDDIGRKFEPTYNLDLSEGNELNNPQAENEFYTYNLLPILQSYFPSVFDEHTQTKGSAGHYAYSIDKYPVIDQILSNLYFASGASGSGIMKADSIARITSGLVLGQETATLFGGSSVKISRFSIKQRDLPDETLVF